MAKYCSNCGSQIDDMAEICPECGVRQAPPGAYQRGLYKQKSPGLAALLSALVVGLGQVYNGEVGKGVLLFVAAIISGVLWLIYIGFLFSLIIWAYAIYDAYNTAQRINAGEIY